tara:strand:- start:50 stop:412 length:363 start_codon:yes stop_codon:yes gene_type:complete
VLVHRSLVLWFLPIGWPTVPYSGGAVLGCGRGKLQTRENLVNDTFFAELGFDELRCDGIHVPAALIGEFSNTLRHQLLNAGLFQMTSNKARQVSLGSLLAGACGTRRAMVCVVWLLLLLL